MSIIPEEKAEEPLDIVLWVSPELLDRPVPIEIHPSQEMFSTDDGGVVITLCAVPNLALLQRIMRYVPDVVVKSPESVRNSFVKLIQQAIDLYKDDD